MNNKNIFARVVEMRQFSRIKNSIYYILAFAFLCGWGLVSSMLPEQVTWSSTAPLFLYSSSCLALAVYVIRWLKRRNDKLSLSDPDNNLYTEQFFLNALKLEFNRSHRYELPLSIMVFSFGDIKEIASQLGKNVHEIQRLLIETVSKTIRNSDIFSVLEQNKFSILLPSTDVDGAKVAANRLKSAISAELKKQRLGQRTTIPFGICGTANCDIKSSEELFAGSIQAYSVALESPRNKVVTCGETCR